MPQGSDMSNLFIKIIQIWKSCYSTVSCLTTGQSEHLAQTQIYLRITGHVSPSLVRAIWSRDMAILLSLPSFTLQLDTILIYVKFLQQFKTAISIYFPCLHSSFLFAVALCLQLSMIIISTVLSLPTVFFRLCCLNFPLEKGYVSLFYDCSC